MEETAIQLIEREPDDVNRKALTYVEQIGTLPPIIKTPVEYLLGGQIWKDGKALLKEIDEGYNDIIRDAHQLHKKAVARKAKYYSPVEDGVKFVKGLLERFDGAQEAIWQAEKRRLREIARKEEEERRLQEAIEAEANGETEEAEAIIQEEIYVPPIILQKETPKVVGGPVYRTVWDFEIVNEGLIPRQYLQPNMVAIGSVVRSLKSATNIPGIRAFSRRV